MRQCMARREMEILLVWKLSPLRHSSSWHWFLLKCILIENLLCLNKFKFSCVIHITMAVTWKVMDSNLSTTVWVSYLWSKGVDSQACASAHVYEMSSFHLCHCFISVTVPDSNHCELHASSSCPLTLISDCPPPPIWICIPVHPVAKLVLCMQGGVGGIDTL